MEKGQAFQGQKDKDSLLPPPDFTMEEIVCEDEESDEDEEEDDVDTSDRSEEEEEDEDEEEEEDEGWAAAREKEWMGRVGWVGFYNLYG